MSAALKLESFILIDDRAAFAAEFNALLNDIEFAVIPASVYPERDFSSFTL